MPPHNSDKVIREATKTILEIDKQIQSVALSPHGRAAGLAAASLNDVIKAALDIEMASDGCSMGEAYSRVTKAHPNAVEMSRWFVQLGIVAKADATDAGDSPAPTRQTRHERASRTVLDRANDLVQRGEHPDLMSALKDKRMRPLLDQWIQSSGT